MRQTTKYPLWFGLLVGLCSLLLTACSASSKATHAPSAEELAKQHRFDSLYLCAVQQKLLERYEAQHRLLDEALRLRPEAPEALYDKGLLLLKSDSAEVVRQGIQMVEQAISRMPNDATLRMPLILYYIDAECYEDAIPHVETLTRSIPDVENLSLLVSLYAHETVARWDDAIKTMEHIERINGKEAETTLSKCQYYLEKGDTIGAYNAIDELCKENPDELSFRVLKGDYYRSMGHFFNAQQEYLAVLNVDPQHPVAQFSATVLYQQVHEDSLHHDMLDRLVKNPQAPIDMKLGALSDDLRAAMQNTETKHRFYRYIHYLLRQPEAHLQTLALYLSVDETLPDETPECDSSLFVFLEQHPKEYDAHLILLQCFAKQQKAEAIHRLCEFSIRHYPDDPLFHYYAVISLFQLEKPEREALQRAWEMLSHEEASEPASDLFMFYGDLLHEEGNSQQAYAVYEAAIKVNPDNIGCLNNYAYFLSLDSRGDLEKAEAMSRRTIEAEPKNPTYLDTYAWILYRMERYTQAQIYIDQTLHNIDESENNSSLYDHAGDIYWQCGNAQEARNFWQKALEQADETTRKDIEKKLKNRR